MIESSEHIQNNFETMSLSLIGRVVKVRDPEGSLHQARIFEVGVTGYSLQVMDESGGTIATVENISHDKLEAVKYDEEEYNFTLANWHSEKDHGLALELATYGKYKIGDHVWFNRTRDPERPQYHTDATIHKVSILVDDDGVSRLGFQVNFGGDNVWDDWFFFSDCENVREGEVFAVSDRDEIDALLDKGIIRNAEHNGR